MGLLRRIFSRKKKKEEKELELKEETPASNYPPYPGGQALPQIQPIQSTSGDDMEFKVLSAKLDALNVKLDMINQRLDNLEKLAKEEPEQKW